MTRSLLAGFVLSLATVVTVPATATAGPPAAESPKGLYPQADDAAVRVEAALAEARKKNTRVLVQWGDDWCGWCVKLHDTMSKDQSLRRKMLYEYELVLIPVGRFDRNLDLAAKWNADYKGGGVPYLTVLAADGSVVANQETSSLEEGSAHDPAKVLAFLTEHEATPRDANAAMTAALAEAKSTDRTVMVHFTAPWCGWCRRLEAWQAQPRVHEILSRHFVDVRIDTDRDAGGAEIFKKHTDGRSTGIPWCAFLAADATVLATSDGPDGNVGFPSSDEEIAAFRDILKNAAPRMTDAEIDALATSLLAERKFGEAAAAARSR
jgi:thiol-disulfide isomerase/thioredoxin